MAEGTLPHLGYSAITVAHWGWGGEMNLILHFLYVCKEFTFKKMQYI